MAFTSKKERSEAAKPRWGKISNRRFTALIGAFFLLSSNEFAWVCDGFVMALLISFCEASSLFSELFSTFKKSLKRLYEVVQDSKRHSRFHHFFLRSEVFSVRKCVERSLKQGEGVERC